MLRAIKKNLFTEIILCLFSALMLAAAFSCGKLWVCAWFALVPFLFAVENTGPRRAFFLSYLCGLVFWAGAIYWLANVTVLGLIVMILYLALYFGAFGLLISRPFIKLPVLFIPAFWVILEYLRSSLLTGFPWALLGYSQYLNLPFIQAADIGGVWLISFFIVLINFIIKEAIAKKNKSYLVSGFILIIVIFGYGFFRLYQQQEGNLLKVSVVQGNIPQEAKWDSYSRDFIIDRYFKLTSQAKADNPDLIVWPEASLPIIPEEEPLYYGKFSRYVKSINKPLLFGAVTLRQGNFYNSALLASSEGVLLGRYDKLHLVPFGEYIPLRNVFSFLNTFAPIGDIAAGRQYTLFKVYSQKIKVPSLITNRPAGFSRRQYQFGVLICFEDIFPGLARTFVNKGADFLINITNDAWFGRSSEAYQHLSASVFRAVENRVYLVRAANTGVSGFIDPRGKIISLVNNPDGRQIFISGFKTQGISIRRQSSFYRNHGDFIVLFCLLILFYIIIFILHKGLAKKIFSVSLVFLTIYFIIVFYFADKYYFISPVNYNGDLLIRSDSMGDGYFGTSRSGNRSHEGLDLFGEVGTPVLAVRSGIVTAATMRRGMGKFIVIRHSPSLASTYGHLSEIFVKKNQLVRQGQVIGAIGKTGNANYKNMQPHLHLEIRKNGIPQDPMEYLE
jgi:apolipoprotein N-acyltransferase